MSIGYLDLTTMCRCGHTLGFEHTVMNRDLPCIAKGCLCKRFEAAHHGPTPQAGEQP